MNKLLERCCSFQNHLLMCCGSIELGNAPSQAGVWTLGEGTGSLSQTAQLPTGLISHTGDSHLIFSTYLHTTQTPGIHN